MVTLNRFFAEPTGNAPISTDSRSPEAAAAPYLATAQANMQVSNELLQISGVFKQQQAKQDQYTLEQANAQLEIDLNKASLELPQTAKQGGVDLTTAAYSQWESISQRIADTMPNNATKQAVLQQALRYKPAFVTGAMKQQYVTGREQQFLTFRNQVEQYIGMTVQSPESIGTVQQKILELGRDTVAAGFDPADVQKITDAAIKSSDTYKYYKDADSNPVGILNDLKSGKFAGKDPDFILGLQKHAEASLQANTKILDNNLKDINKNILAGIAPPNDWEVTKAQADAYNLTSQSNYTQFLIDTRSKLAPLQPSQQQAYINGLQVAVAQNPNLLDADSLKDIQTMVKSNVERMKSDPLQYAQEQGIVQPLPPLVTNPQDPGYAASINNRRLAAEQAAVFSQSRPVAMTKPELEAIDQQLPKMTISEKMSTAKLLSDLGGENIEGFTQELYKKNPEFSVALQYMSTNPELSEEIIRGIDISNSTLKKSPSSSDKLTAVNDVLGDLYANDQPELRDNLIRAAESVYNYELSKGGTPSFKDSLKKVTGAINVDRKGVFSGSYKTIPPVIGMSEGDFKNIITNVDWTKQAQGTPYYAGGLPYDAEKDSLFNYDLVPVAQGAYYLKKGDSKLLNAQGQPYLLNLRNAEVQVPKY